ncbi:zinc finger domain-containing protein [Dehalogenimonas etheniformans]|uniref:Endonuclease VIII n=1 Tax=Dehalogenimonas etheniformans TaxID=1536648 RepID=A0A2P5P837_9CHLR|nr:zinc finger domain-containing protein [Dehalogenimonas etheniformans]PPD58461.1 endonuclease VIII [Dehalogenimonas etheniformans]QNT75854.1 endonuclease VIII [Dehalogenimonas etheniformans]
MIELPEASVLATQLRESIVGKQIVDVITARSPHKFAWYFGDPKEYVRLLVGKIIDGVTSYGGQVEVSAADARILFSDGVNLRYFEKGDMVPDKHQLLLNFDDRTFLVGSVQMYGGLSAFRDGENVNPYYVLAKSKPSPLSKEFDEAYFDALFDDKASRLSLKACLATEQRIPGLGNGVLQDILYNAKLHPKTKAAALSTEEKKILFISIKSTLSEMAAQGGRDTENDLFGKAGGYKTKLSKNTVGQPCPVCKTEIKKESYLGGSIYYCPRCQNFQ